MTRWQEFRSALRGLVTAYRERSAWNLVVLAMWLHPGLVGEMVRIVRDSGKAGAGSS